MSLMNTSRKANVTSYTLKIVVFKMHRVALSKYNIWAVKLVIFLDQISITVLIKNNAGIQLHYFKIQRSGFYLKNMLTILFLLKKGEKYCGLIFKWLVQDASSIVLKNYTYTKHINKLTRLVDLKENSN